MNLTFKSLGIAAQLLMAAGTLNFTASQTLADPVDAFRTISINPPRLPHSRHVEHDHDAGVLTIDGRRFVLSARYSIEDQVVRAFDRMGYDAWCVGGSIRVLKDRDGPEIRWRDGEFSMQFRERRTTLTLTPTRCSERDTGHAYRYDFDTQSQSYRGFAEVQLESGGVQAVALGINLREEVADDDHPPAGYRVSAEHGIDRKVVEGPKPIQKVEIVKEGQKGAVTTPSARVNPPKALPIDRVDTRLGDAGKTVESKPADKAKESVNPGKTPPVKVQTDPDKRARW